jgi:hypothetical protein
VKKDVLFQEMLNHLILQEIDSLFIIIIMFPIEIFAEIFKYIHYDDQMFYYNTINNTIINQSILLCNILFPLNYKTIKNTKNKIINNNLFLVDNSIYKTYYNKFKDIIKTISFYDKHNYIYVNNKKYYKVDLSYSNITNTKINTFEIIQNINCINLSNNQLTSIPNINNIYQLDLSFNMINTFTNIQCNILNISHNPLSIDNIFFSNQIEELYIEKIKYLNLSTIQLPFQLKKLNISNNNIIDIYNLPNTITELNVSNNLGINIQYFPNQLKKLNISNCAIQYIYNLPNTIKYLNISKNNIKDITFPDSLEILNMSYTKYYGIFPLRLKTLYLSHNQYNETLDFNFECLTKLDVSYNELIKINTKNVIKLYCNNNINLTEIHCCDKITEINIKDCFMLYHKINDIMNQYSFDLIDNYILR